jgi:hypothetical protein
MFLLTVSKDSNAPPLFLEHVSSRVRHLAYARNNAPGRCTEIPHRLKSHEGGSESLPCFDYKEYVIYRDPMDCYHHSVHLLESFIPATSDSTSSTTHTARRGLVVGCHTNCKGAHRAIPQRKSCHWRTS